MRRDWSAEELSELWTLGPAELVLVGGLPDASKVGLAAQLVYCHGRAHGRPGDNPAALYSRQRPTPDLPGALRARQGGQDRLPLPLPRRGGAARRNPRGAERRRNLEQRQRLHLLWQRWRGGQQSAGGPGDLGARAPPAAILPGLREHADAVTRAGRTGLDGAHDAGRPPGLDAARLGPRQSLRRLRPRYEATARPGCSCR